VSLLLNASRRTKSTIFMRLQVGGNSACHILLRAKICSMYNSSRQFVAPLLFCFRTMNTLLPPTMTIAKTFYDAVRNNTINLYLSSRLLDAYVDLVQSVNSKTTERQISAPTYEMLNGSGPFYTRKMWSPVDAKRDQANARPFERKSSNFT